MTRALVLLLVLLPASLAAQDPWAAFTPGTFARVIREEAPGIDSMPGPGPVGNIAVTAKTWPQRVTVIFTGDRRPMSEGNRKVIDVFARDLTHDSVFVTRFADEFRFTENGLSYWLPVQRVWEADFLKDVHPGDRVTLLTRWLGTFHGTGQLQWVFVANNFEDPPFDAPPSQYELNGYLLGQGKASIRRALGAPFQTIPHEDGWMDEAYLLSRPYHAYMGFKFEPGDSLHAIAVQVAGDPGTAMRPFLGIHLGSTRQEVEARFGPPSEVSHEDDVDVDLLTWAGRNYSFEVDTAGRVNSIQILGYEGIRERPLDTEPDPLARLKATAATGSTDSLLAILAPDLAFIQDSVVTRFTRAPRVELDDPTSPVRTRLAKITAALRTPPSESAVRVQMGAGVGLVYKWDHGDVQELFFPWMPGGYRLGEVRFR